MSETVNYRGVLREVVKFDGETIEDQCKRLLDNKELDSYCDSYKEMLLDEGYYDWVMYDNILYSVEKEDVDPYNDLFTASKNEDGTINFEVRYYNGGCGFEEAIEYALEKMGVK